MTDYREELKRWFEDHSPPAHFYDMPAGEFDCCVPSLLASRWLARIRAEAWDEGFRVCDQTWTETADIVTPDEDRTSSVNPYRTAPKEATDD